MTNTPKIKMMGWLLLIAAFAFGGWLLAGKPGPHRHQLVKMTTPEGKIYYTCAMHPQVRQNEPGSCPVCGMKLVKRSEAPAAGTMSEPAAAEKKPLYWYDPMKPEVKFGAPGKSPFMDMQLVPRYAEAGAAPGGSDEVQIDPRMVQNLGVRTSKVRRGSLASSLETVGVVMANERGYTTVESRVSGWVERLAVRAVNDPVRRGELLAEIYAPELLAAQQEFLLAVSTGDASLVAASKSRLGFLGLNTSQIAQLARSHQSTRRVSLFAPADGYVMELGVREGAQVAPGMALFKLADLSSVWVSAEVPEALAAQAVEGAPVQVRLAAFPGEVFKGKVDFIYPELTAATRTLKLRAVLANRERKLRPGMFAQLSLGAGTAKTALLVDTPAIIQKGGQALVLVADGGGRFKPTLVSTGAERGGQTEILSGLEEGAEVVVSGQFLIDSEANLSGVLERFAPATPAAKP